MKIKTDMAIIYKRKDRLQNDCIIHLCTFFVVTDSTFFWKESCTQGNPRIEFKNKDRQNNF